MLKINKKQLSTWIIVIIMVGSTVGFASFYFTQLPQEPQIKQPDKPAEDEGQTQYSADDVDGTVLEVIPRLLVSGETKDFNIDNIDKEIRSLDGVVTVRSGFKEQAIVGDKLTYIAAVELKADAKPLDFAQQLEANVKSLEGVSAFPVALVEIQRQLTVFNKEKNLTRMQNFPDGLIQAYVSPDVEKNDKVTLTINIQYVGGNFADAVAFQKENLSSKPFVKSLELSLPIESLEAKLVVNATSTFSASIDKNAVEKSLKDFSGATSAEAEFKEDESQLVVEFADAVDFVKAFADINSGINAIGGVAVTGVNEETAAMQLNFEQTADYVKLKDSVTNAISKSGFKQSDFTLHEPQISLRADLNFMADADLPKLAPKLEDLLKKAGFVKVNVYALAIFESDAFSFADENKTLVNPKQTFRAAVLPGRQAGEKVNLLLNIFGQRSSILYVDAKETEPSSETESSESEKGSI